MLFRKIWRPKWLDDDTVQSFEDEDEEVCLIVKQGIFPADVLPSEDVSFPWHRRTEADFERLHIRMRKVLPELMACQSARDVSRFRRRYPEVYEAYFQRPIQFSDEDSCVNDGRHRIYIAQKLKSVIPAWKVEYRPKSEITLEEYRKCVAFGEWKFHCGKNDMSKIWKK